ncbi:MAG: RNA polymerase sigma factor [Saprospiraceae bacterium]
MSVTFSSKSKSTQVTGNPETSAAMMDEKAVFYQKLKDLESNAIRQLARRVGDFLPGLSASVYLSMEDREELVSDAVFITLQKIGNGQFELKDADPATYAIGVLKNLVGNRLQKKRIETAPLENLMDLSASELDPEKYLQRKEREELMDSLLNKMEDLCRQLILLRYYEEISDDEAIAQKRTPYLNVDSLKVQRSKCLKKLAGLVRKHRELFR